MFCYEGREDLASYLVVPNIFLSSCQHLHKSTVAPFSGTSDREITKRMKLRVHFRAINLPVVFLKALAPPKSFVRMRQFRQRPKEKEG